MFEGTERIELLADDVIALIGDGKKESIDTVLEKIQGRGLIHYLMDRYRMFAITKDCPYDIMAWENALGEYEYMEKHHDVERKCGITNDNDGLLLIVYLIIQILAKRSYEKK